ncbi:MAG: glycosyltransferase [Candidatus Sulfotelmatobacter sp.]
MFTSLSVVIPTYNRKDILVKALDGYLAQSAPHLIQELLVVDDGSTDDTESAVLEYAHRAPFQVRYLKQSKKGQAAARNYGIREASCSLVLLTDSDIIPQPSLVEQHLEWHNNNPDLATAVLGYVTWSPEVKATPFMRWYGEEALFAYRRFRGKRQVECRYFYTCNLSLKTEFLRRCGLFDEDFKTYGYEDMELGYRLNKEGLQLLYNRDATAHHYQFICFEDACRKGTNASEGLRLFEQKESAKDWVTWHQKRAATLKFRVASLMAAGVAIAIGWSRRLPDSRVPLPPIIYHCLYWYRVNFRPRKLGMLDHKQ